MSQIQTTLSETRAKLGLSAAELARRAGVDPQTITAAEAGRLGTVATLSRHLKALGYELRAVRRRG